MSAERAPEPQHIRVGDHEVCVSRTLAGSWSYATRRVDEPWSPCATEYPGRTRDEGLALAVAELTGETTKAPAETGAEVKQS